MVELKLLCLTCLILLQKLVTRIVVSLNQYDVISSCIINERQIRIMDGPSPRILKQTSSLLNDPIIGVDFRPDPNNFRHFFAILHGQSKTPYKGGLFKLEITLPEYYPLHPPKVVFLTKIYHPNVSMYSLQINEQGVINLSLLGKNWSPVFLIRSVIINIQSLLRYPEPDQAHDAQIGELWKRNPVSAQRTAQEYTRQYAKD